MTAALQGLRVLDVSNGPVGGICSMILADFGAEVLRLQTDDAKPVDSLPAARMWRRGGFVTQLDDQSQTLQQACAAADVLLVSWRPSTLRKMGLDLQQLRAACPQLVICHITSFGPEDPRSELPGYEHVVAAASGRMQSFSGCADRDGPVFSALQVGVHACAQSATAAIISALFHRQRSAAGGRLVNVSMLRALLAYEQGAMIGEQFRDRFGVMIDFLPGANAKAPDPTLHYLPVQAADHRWVQLGNLLPHLFDNYLIATELLDILADPEFDSAQMNLPEEKREAFRERMMQRMQEKSAHEWMRLFVENGGVVAGLVQSTQEAMDDPDIVANGHRIERADGAQLGPLARLSETPAQPGPPQQNGDALLAQWLADPRPQMTAEARSTNQLPLVGVRVVEIATIIAAPFGASMLADLGADVIKIEPIGEDPYRGMAGGIGAARVNLGKQSICLNLKDPDAQNIASHILKQADVVLHNFRPGVAEKLGIGFEQVKANNPNVIYVQSNGYGPEGPGAHRPSTHPVPGAAMGGVWFQMAGNLPDRLLELDELRDWSRRIMRANEVNPDPNTALVIASAISLALLARERTGVGQQVFVDMFGANAYANADDFLRYEGKPERAMPDADLLGLGPFYRLYRCAQGSWVFLCLSGEKVRQKFTEVVRGVGYDIAEKLSEVPEQLETLFAQAHADEWEALCTEHAIACVRADRALPKDFWLHENQREFVEPSEHGEWGAFMRPGPLYQFDGAEPARLSAPSAGEHTDELLAKLGSSQPDIDGLRSRRILS